MNQHTHTHTHIPAVQLTHERLAKYGTDNNAFTNFSHPASTVPRIHSISQHSPTVITKLAHLSTLICRSNAVFHI